MINEVVKIIVGKIKFLFDPYNFLSQKEENEGYTGQIPRSPDFDELKLLEKLLDTPLEAIRAIFKKMKSEYETMYSLEQKRRIFVEDAMTEAEAQSVVQSALEEIGKSEDEIRQYIQTKKAKLKSGDVGE